MQTAFSVIVFLLFCSFWSIFMTDGESNPLKQQMFVCEAEINSLL